MNFINSEFLTNNELKKIKFKKIGKKVLISKNAVLIGTENISISDYTRIDPFTVLMCPRGYIKIGKVTHISTNILICGHNGIKIGNFCGIGSGTKIYSSSESYTGESVANLNLLNNDKFKKYSKFDIGEIIINDHTNIGANCTILPQTNIGKNCAIGANSVIKNFIKSGFIYSGNPLKAIIKKSKKNLDLAKKIKKNI